MNDSTQEIQRKRPIHSQTQILIDSTTHTRTGHINEQANKENTGKEQHRKGREH